MAVWIKNEIFPLTPVPQKIIVTNPEPLPKPYEPFRIRMFSLTSFFYKRTEAVKPRSQPGESGNGATWNDNEVTAKPRSHGS